MTDQMTQITSKLDQLEAGTPEPKLDTPINPRRPSQDPFFELNPSRPNQEPLFEPNPKRPNLEPNPRRPNPELFFEPKSPKSADATYHYKQLLSDQPRLHKPCISVPLEKKRNTISTPNATPMQSMPTISNALPHVQS